MVHTNVLVTHSVGLHARPASLFVQTAKKFKAQIRVKNLTAKSELVDAKSIIRVLTLGVLQNHIIHIEAEGEDADQAVASLQSLVASNFSQGE